MVIMGSLYFLYIFIYFFLYRASQCRAQLGTNKVVVVAASIHYYLTETDITHMDDFPRSAARWVFSIVIGRNFPRESLQTAVQPPLSEQLLI